MRSWFVSKFLAFGTVLQAGPTVLPCWIVILGTALEIEIVVVLFVRSIGGAVLSLAVEVVAVEQVVVRDRLARLTWLLRLLNTRWRALVLCLSAQPCSVAMS